MKSSEELIAFAKEYLGPAKIYAEFDTTEEVGNPLVVRDERLKIQGSMIELPFAEEPFEVVSKEWKCLSRCWHIKAERTDGENQT